MQVVSLSWGSWYQVFPCLSSWFPDLISFSGKLETSDLSILFIHFSLPEWGQWFPNSCSFSSSFFIFITNLFNAVTSITCSHIWSCSSCVHWLHNCQDCCYNLLMDLSCQLLVACYGNRRPVFCFFLLSESCNKGCSSSRITPGILLVKWSIGIDYEMCSWQLYVSSFNLTKRKFGIRHQQCFWKFKAALELFQRCKRVLLDICWTTCSPKGFL